MNYRLLPDLLAMAVLLTVLYFLRRRHPQERVGLWIVGLLFIFIEAIAHSFYRPTGPTHIPSHIVALDAYLAAGVIFLWAAASPLYPRRKTLTYLIANSLPLAAILTTYALDLRKPVLYHVIIACGLLIGIASPFVINRTFRLRAAWWLIITQLLVWIPAWISSSRNHDRDAAYFPLFVLYLSTALVFHLSLPRRSLGKVCIVSGFTLWSLVFLFHSWVTDRPQYIDSAAQIWDMQKFLVTIGMLLVLLELQVSSNEWHAFHDPLTGLPNRRFFEDRLPHLLQHAERTQTRTALIMIDLNGFKLINDSLGHDTGDHLLQHIAQRLRHIIRTPDTLVRLGGDEFIIITTDLPITPAVAAVIQASHKRIADALARPFTVDGRQLTASGSIGIAIYPDDTTDEVLLRRLADQRMYEQKRQTALQLQPTPLAAAQA